MSLFRYGVSNNLFKAQRKGVWFRIGLGFYAEASGAVGLKYRVPLFTKWAIRRSLMPKFSHSSVENSVLPLKALRSFSYSWPRARPSAGSSLPTSLASVTDTPYSVGTPRRLKPACPLRQHIKEPKLMVTVATFLLLNSESKVRSRVNSRFKVVQVLGMCHLDHQVTYTYCLNPKSLKSERGKPRFRAHALPSKPCRTGRQGTCMADRQLPGGSV